MNLKFLFSSGLGNKLIFLNQYVENMKKKDIIKTIFKSELLELDKNGPNFFKNKSLKIIYLALRSRLQNSSFILNIHINKPLFSYIVQLISGDRIYFMPSLYYKDNNIQIVKTSEKELIDSLITKEYFENFFDIYFKDSKGFKEESFNENKYSNLTSNKYILIHLGSDEKSTNKRPSPKILASVFNTIIKKRKINIILIGQKQDQNISEIFENHLEKEIKDNSLFINLVDKTDLYQLCDLLMQCKLLIAGDSGVRQLADILGVNNIGIFGPTSETKNLIPRKTHFRKIIRTTFCEGTYSNTCKCQIIDGISSCLLNQDSVQITNELNLILDKI